MPTFHVVLIKRRYISSGYTHKHIPTQAQHDSWHSIRSHAHFYWALVVRSFTTLRIACDVKHLLLPLTPFERDKVIIMVHRILSLFFSFSFFYLRRFLSCTPVLFSLWIGFYDWKHGVRWRGIVVGTLFVPSKCTI